MCMHLLLAIGQTRSQLLLQLRPQAIHPLVNGILQAIHLITVCSLCSTVRRHEFCRPWERH
jgi:recombinational DNA repair protein RecR